MSDWLAPVRAALSVLDRRAPIFFRDDDAGWDDAELWNLLDLFDEHEVPIDVAVIPTAVTPALAAALRVRLEGSRVRIHQHGYAHENHEADGRKCEFGRSRTAADQRRDLAAGRRVLLAAFDTMVDPVFTPPWNRCTPETVIAMATERLTVLSQDATAAPLEGSAIVEVPITVDWLGRRKGTRLSHDELARRLAMGLASGGPVGVMLHHAQIDGAERARIAELLAVLSAHPAAEPTDIVSLATRPPARAASSHP